MVGIVNFSGYLSFKISSVKGVRLGIDFHSSSILFLLSSINRLIISGMYALISGSSEGGNQSLHQVFAFANGLSDWPETLALLSSGEPLLQGQVGLHLV